MICFGITTNTEKYAMLNFERYALWSLVAILVIAKEMQEPTAVLETRTKAHDLKRSLRINRDKLPRQFL